MSQTFTNIGPIYTTQAKYDALVQAGTVELGREYVITDAIKETPAIASSSALDTWLATQTSLGKTIKFLYKEG